MLVWIDLEMTGLDPTSDVIVEIATLVTDDELELVAEGPDLVIATPPADIRRWNSIRSGVGLPPWLRPSNVAALMIRFRSRRGPRVASSKSSVTAPVWRAAACSRMPTPVGSAWARRLVWCKAVDRASRRDQPRGSPDR